MHQQEHPFVIGVPRVGDEIYVDTILGMAHGEGVVGGKATVLFVSQGRYAGEPVPMVAVREHPNRFYNWHFLGRKQHLLRARFGSKRARPDGDFEQECSHPHGG